MSRIVLSVAVLMSLATPSVAQTNSIKWGNDVKRGIAAAKRSHKPLMFWVVGRSGDRDDDIERDQKRAFRDPLVRHLSRRFVTVKMSRSVHRDLLEKWQMHPRTNLTIVYATPAGEKLGELSPGGATNADSLAQKTNLVFRLYREKLFQSELKPKLEDEQATTKHLRTALKMVKEFTILSADKSVAALLERKRLDKGIQKGCYDVLAELSTQRSVQELLDWAVKEKAAADALARCTPQAAEYMLDKLGGEDPELHVIVYQAVTKICRLKSPKPVGFWKGKNERIKAQEIERVKELVRKKARDWSRRYAEYR